MAISAIPSNFGLRPAYRYEDEVSYVSADRNQEYIQAIYSRDLKALKDLFLSEPNVNNRIKTNQDIALAMYVWSLIRDPVYARATCREMLCNQLESTTGLARHTIDRLIDHLDEENNFSDGFFDALKYIYMEISNATLSKGIKLSLDEYYSETSLFQLAIMLEMPDLLKYVLDHGYELWMSELPEQKDFLLRDPFTQLQESILEVLFNRGCHLKDLLEPAETVEEFLKDAFFKDNQGLLRFLKSKYYYDEGIRNTTNRYLELLEVGYTYFYTTGKNHLPVETYRRNDNNEIFIP